MTTVDMGMPPIMLAALNERVERLKLAGFTVSYVFREDADGGRVQSSLINGEHSWGVKVRTVTGEPDPMAGEPWVSFENVACSDDAYGQADTVRRSNYIAICRDFPDVPWVDVSYLNMNGLGIFVADLDDDLMDLFVGLAESYPVYDESAMSDLEQEEIHASWADWVRGDLWRELPEVTRTTMWDFLGGDTVTELWWTCVSAEVFGSYPEHRGSEVAWGDMAERARDFRPYLSAAYWAKRTGRDTEDDAPMWRWVDRLADRLRARKEVDRLYRLFMADDTIMHHDRAWREYLDSRGWTITATGARRKGTEEA